MTNNDFGFSNTSIPWKMESLRRSLRPLDYTLNLSGLWLFQPFHFWFRGLIILHFIAFNSSSLINIYLTIVWKLHHDSSSINLHVMYIFKNTMSEIIGIIVSFVILFSRNTLKKIVQEVCQEISRKQHRNLFRITLIFLVYRIVKQTDRFVSTYYWYLELISRQKNIWLLDVLQAYKFLFDSWEVIGLATFISVLKIIHFAKKNMIQGLINRFDKDSKNINQDIIYESIRKILRLKNMLTKSMSFIICLFFLNMFADFVMAAIRLQKPRYTTYEREFLSFGLDAMRLVMTIVETIYLTFLTTNLCEESQNNLGALETRIAWTRKPRKWMFVMDQINKAQNYEYKAWNLFTINKGILLSFTAALVSFTVLFAQLLGSVV